MLIYFCHISVYFYETVAELTVAINSVVHKIYLLSGF